MEKIDVHCHPLTPKYRQYLLENNQEHPDGMPAIPTWSPEQHLKFMHENKITHSVLSITSPGTNILPNDIQTEIERTREFNRELSVICSSHPKELSFFASLPLQDIQASIQEINNSIDDLGAKGFCFLSNTNGVYLGDPTLDPVFEVLNERKAIIFIHPTCPCLPTTRRDGKKPGLNNFNPLNQYPAPMMEFMFDESRSISNLLLSGTVTKYPNVKYIMSHCGGVLPSIIDRVGFIWPALFGKENQTNEFKRLLKERFWFDLAGTPFPAGIKGLMGMLDEGGGMGEEKLLYGSDYPLTPEKPVVGLMEVMEKGLAGMFDEKYVKRIMEGNARSLLGI